jgi:hypothetical protein
MDNLESDIDMMTEINSGIQELSRHIGIYINFTAKVYQPQIGNDSITNSPHISSDLLTLIDIYQSLKTSPDLDKISNGIQLLEKLSQPEIGIEPGWIEKVLFIAAFCYHLLGEKDEVFRIFYEKLHEQYTILTSDVSILHPELAQPTSDEELIQGTSIHSNKLKEDSILQ